MPTRYPDTELFERIVQEVIRRLLERGVDIAAGDAKQLAVDDRVVTLGTLEGKLEGVDCVQVRKRAVVTPAVKDELNRRRIKLVVDQPSN